MINIQFVTVPGCHECAKAKKIFEELKPEFPQMQVEEVSATTPKGIELVQKYGIMASPGIVINNELFSTGGVDKTKLVGKLKTLL